MKRNEIGLGGKVRAVVIAALLTSGLFITMERAWSHAGHDHDLTKQEAISKAVSVLTFHVKKGRSIGSEVLADSWLQATEHGMCRHNGEHFIIAFHNPSEDKTLHLLLSVDGKYKRANFDGQFADLTFSPFQVKNC